MATSNQNLEIVQKAEYQDSYRALKKCRLWKSIVLITILVLSVGLPALHFFLPYHHTWAYLLDFVNIACIITYYILNVVSETFLCPAAATQNSRGFIDNSLGSKYLAKEVNGNFSNDNIPVGSYKLAVNCFENVFWTYNIAKAMTPYVVIKNALCLFVFVIIAYIGLMNSVFALPILQILLSSMFLSELIHHLNFVSKLKSLNYRFRSLFEQGLTKSDLARPIFFVLDYESVKAYNKAPFSDRVFLRLYDKLTDEWEEVKKRYDIR